jgi:hypothetical protein
MSFTTTGGVKIQELTVLQPTPGKPRLLTANQNGSDTIFITFDLPPESVPPSPPTSVTVIVQPGDIPFYTQMNYNPSSVQLFGLSIGTTYTMTLSVQNMFGSGPVSNSVTVTMIRPTADGPNFYQPFQTSLDGVMIPFTPPVFIGLQSPFGYNIYDSPSTLISTNKTATMYGATATLIGFRGYSSNSTYTNAYNINYSLTMGFVSGGANPLHGDGGYPPFLPWDNATTATGAAIGSPTHWFTQYSGKNYSVAPAGNYNPLIGVGPFDISFWLRPDNNISSTTTTHECIFENATFIQGATIAGFSVYKTYDGKISLVGAKDTGVLTVIPFGYDETNLKHQNFTILKANNSLPVPSSTYFNGGNYLQGPSDVPILTTGPFSIEFWIKPDSLSTTVDRCLLENARLASGNNGGFRVFLTTGNRIRLDVYNGTYNTNPTTYLSGTEITIPSTAVFTHIAISRNAGNGINFWMNGKCPIGSTGYTRATSLNLKGDNGGVGSTTPIVFRIGASVLNGVTSNGFAGHIWNLRIIQGDLIYDTSGNLSSLTNPEISELLELTSGYFYAQNGDYTFKTFPAGSTAITACQNDNPTVMSTNILTGPYTFTNINNVTTVRNVPKWVHVVISRDVSNVIRIFYNGVADSATVTHSKSLNSIDGAGGVEAAAVRMGASYVSSVYQGPYVEFYTGRIFDLRVLPGFARTTNFTPPTDYSPTSENLLGTFNVNGLQNKIYTFFGTSKNNYGEGPLGSLALTVPVVRGQILFTTSTLGTFNNQYSGYDTTWTVPAGVYSISAVAIGSGAGGYYSAAGGGGGGGGGGLCYITYMAVIPGDVLRVHIAPGVEGWSADTGAWWGANTTSGNTTLSRTSSYRKGVSDTWDVVISAGGGNTGTNAGTGGTGGTALNLINPFGYKVVGYNGGSGRNGSGVASAGQGGSAANWTSAVPGSGVGASIFGSADTNSANKIYGKGGTGGKFTAYTPATNDGKPGVIRIVWPADPQWGRQYPNTNVDSDL